MRIFWIERQAKRIIIINRLRPVPVDLEQAISTCEYEVNEYLFNKKWKIVQQELPFEEEKAETEIHAEAVPEAETPVLGNADMENFQAAMNSSSVTMNINGKNIKPRRTRRASSKQLAS